MYQRDAEEVTVREDEQNKPDIKQFRMDVSFNGKADAIVKILEETGFDRCMAFCNTKGSTERITKFLQMRGIDAQCIHGDIPQKKREQVMDLFRKGELRVFVSTDVAARPGAAAWLDFFRRIGLFVIICFLSFTRGKNSIYNAERLRRHGFFAPKRAVLGMKRCLWRWCVGSAPRRGAGPHLRHRSRRPDHFDAPV